MILNPENVCLECGKPKTPGAASCNRCRTEYSKRGRPQKVSDETILEAVRSGCDSADAILEAVGLKSKVNLMIRLRRLRDAGSIIIKERPWHEGHFIIRAKED